MFYPKNADAILFLSTLILVWYIFYIHLPNDMTERWRLQIFDYVLRLTYKFPMRSLAFLGHHFQAFWIRISLQGLAYYYMNPWKSAPDLKITNTYFRNVPVRVYEPVHRLTDSSILFIHGGGFVSFSIESYEGVMRDIVRKSGMTTISIGYRLAPEHPFPAGLDDVLNATMHYLIDGAEQLGLDPTRVAIMGDSAGGNLAAVTSQYLRQMRGLPRLRAQVLLYPLLQFVDFQTPSYQRFYEEYPDTAFLDPNNIANAFLMYTGLKMPTELVTSNQHVTRETVGRMRALVHHDSLPESFFPKSYQMWSASEANYTSATSSLLQSAQDLLTHPLISPLLTPDLTDVPAAYIVTCGYDILRDEGVWYAQRLKKFDVPVKWVHYESGFHGMVNFMTDIPLGHQVVEDLAQYLKVIM